MATFSESTVCVSPGSKQRFDLSAFQASFQAPTRHAERQREKMSERLRGREGKREKEVGDDRSLRTTLSCASFHKS